jgi:hypothetical protein
VEIATDAERIQARCVSLLAEWENHKEEKAGGEVNELWRPCQIYPTQGGSAAIGMVKGRKKLPLAPLYYGWCVILMH